MRKTWNGIVNSIVCTTLFVLCVSCKTKDTEKERGELGYRLVWSDEFDNTGAPDSTFWSFEQGFVRNQEHQWYQEENAFCKDGLLIIEARTEDRDNPLYQEDDNHWRRSRKKIEFTSSSINTARKFEFQYGRVEVKARIPVGGGAWPAIWTLGRAMEWPSNGEIDIMEYYRIDGVPHILANAAWGTEQQYHAKWNTKTVPFSYFTEKDPQWAEKFHIWRMDWDETSIKLFLDDELLNEIPLDSTINGSLGAFKNPFKQPHYLLLNLAIGGINGGEPDPKAFPMRYEIDYVRVYQKKRNSFQPGEIWSDDRGMHINAHGGGILFHKNKYYWFGEHKGRRSNNAFVGVTCYSSDDLYNWKYEGVALPVDENPDSPITVGCIMERPKVIYNRKTNKFVMYFHLELKGKGYEAAQAGVAVSDNPTGPYTLVRNARVNPNVWPLNMTDEQKNSTVKLADFAEWWTPDWRVAVNDGLFVRRDFESGQMSRDMTLFVDDDEKGYHIYSSEENLTLHIAELADDYLTHSGRYIRVEPGGHNEAPAIFRKDGRYYMITSGCTGWAPNAARLLVADNIMGEWKLHPNPCRGEDAELTFKSQSTYILPIQGKKDAFIFMADRWMPRDPIDGRYVWLPIQFEAGLPVLRWMDEWNLNDIHFGE